MARIVIDAGHGGSARAGNSSAYGSRGPSGLLEKDVTLDIARHVVTRLGGDAALTRTGDANLPLGARAAHASRDGADVFVSIHANSGPPEMAGPETWIHPDAGADSHRLAGGIQRALERLAGRYGGSAESRRGPMAVLSPGAIGRRTAACLVEVDYLSNPRGEQRLGDPRERAAIGAAIAGAIREHLGHAGLAHAMAAPRFDVRYVLGLVPQPTGVSCWAAAAAMMVAWREQMSGVNAADVAAGAGNWAAYHTGLHPRDVPDLAASWDLVAEPPQSYSVEGLRHLLEAYGPLWIVEAVPGLHAIVIAGIHGDGTPDGTKVIIKDPWPPGTGAEYEWTFRQAMQTYESAAGFAGVNIQILHNGGRGPVRGIQPTTCEPTPDLATASPAGVDPTTYTTDGLFHEIDRLASLTDQRSLDERGALIRELRAREIVVTLHVDRLTDTGSAATPPRDEVAVHADNGCGLPIFKPSTSVRVGDTPTFVFRFSDFLQHHRMIRFVVVEEDRPGRRSRGAAAELGAIHWEPRNGRLGPTPIARGRYRISVRVRPR